MTLTLSSSPAQLREQFLRLRTPQDVASLLEIEWELLIYHLYIVPRHKRYTVFEIPKRSGGIRRISAPATALKIIQQKLNQVLQHVYQPKPSVHSFVSGRCIVTNAEPHSKSKHILNIDLKDFFPSINFGRVRGMFMGIPYKLDPAVATVLAQICCFNNELPQGAPTSPIISNMICAKMDSQLQALAQQYRCFYTRYADDITFSTYLRDFPSALAGTSSSGEVEVAGELDSIVKGNGFEINTSKVRLRSANRRQEVTGLTTNKFPNIQRKFVRQIRAMLHAWEKFGLEGAQEEFFKHYDKKHRSPLKQPPSFQQVVKGKIEFVGMVKGKGHHVYRGFRKQLRALAPELVHGSEDPLEPLLKMYNDLAALEDPQRRGYMLQDLLQKTFDFYKVPVIGSFTRNEQAEQIDGAFKFEGWHYLVECRWRKKKANIADVRGLKGKVGLSGKQTMGFFLSIEGWSKNVPKILKLEPQKDTILMDGNDLRHVLSGVIDLREFIDAKVWQFTLKTEPFYGAEQYLEDHCNA